MSSIWAEEMAATDQVVPHDQAGLLLAGGLALAVIVAAGLSGWALLAVILILVVCVAVAVDLTAHGWEH